MLFFWKTRKETLTKNVNAAKMDTLNFFISNITTHMSRDEAKAYYALISSICKINYKALSRGESIEDLNEKMRIFSNGDN